MAHALQSMEATTLPVGADVEVSDRFTGRWCRGFAVAGLEPDGYLLRRLSDGRILPAAFPFRAVRRAG